MDLFPSWTVRPPRTLVVDIRKDEYDCYVGRAGTGMDGPWGNPFRRGQHPNPIGAYREWLEIKLKQDLAFRDSMLKLKGLRLGCFCCPLGGYTWKDPLICHGQVIAQWLDTGIL